MVVPEIARVAQLGVVDRTEADSLTGGEVAETESDGDGGYDAFMKALAKAARKFDLKLPRLVDYAVRIPPGGKTGALVEAVITWRTDARKRPFSTMAVDSDQIAAAVKATEKMLNLIAADDRRR